MTTGRVKVVVVIFVLFVREDAKRLLLVDVGGADACFWSARTRESRGEANHLIAMGSELPQSAGLFIHWMFTHRR
jgi:hypothetical protein